MSVPTVKKTLDSFVSTTNACKMCKPLGAALAFMGIEGCVPFLHGSQGCATYMRRYVISHFREPVDIASSALGEKSAIHGGGPNLKLGLLNVMKKYGAGVIGVASTCLTETIGDDVSMLVKEFRKEFADLPLPEVVHVATPSYGGTQAEGFQAALRAVADQLAEDRRTSPQINVLPGFVSCEDIRHLKDVFEHFGLDAAILPDYSERLDAPAQADYVKISEGGLPVSRIKAMGGARASIEFGRTLDPAKTAGGLLAERFGVPLYSLGMPVGLRETDAFFAVLEELSGRAAPRRHELARGRLVDAYVDGHKYLSGKTAVIYGEEDMAVGLASFLAEIGVRPLLVASGGESGRLTRAVSEVTADILREPPEVRQGVDFYEIAARARELSPDLVIGNSKGYRVLARDLNVPLIRVGFPIHDRFGAQRVQHLGYAGAQVLFDRIVNAVIDRKQTDSDIGYGYI
ncbi:oxidoreductase/nitrogenase component 1 [Alkalidesulfovibrio alkalitolerans DSM 16529]|uniref:Oxidoreductase/nitrogenase component 1 n=2 Tax=Alkalidesulfovibrio alkalitolerans TaxID=293256 RepID=S7UNW0_9BACT|nr:oxidoreductase/nitrogenase component 1 [Alkalidesulfovibrio alkalitolerans DSM 16529]